MAPDTMLPSGDEPLGPEPAPTSGAPGTDEEAVGPASDLDSTTSPGESSPSSGADASAETAGSASSGGSQSPGRAPWARELVREMPGWLASMIVHTVVIVLLMLIELPAERPEAFRQLIASSGDDLEELDTLDDQPPEEMNLDATSEAPSLAVEEVVQAPLDTASAVEDVQIAAPRVELADLGLEKAMRRDMLAEIGAYGGSELSGRSGRARQKMVAKYGGTKESEAAVAAALRWLAEHQMPDGGWSFDHRECPTCRGQCRNPGDLGSVRNAATALALLPFLGAGQTHVDKESPYRQNVQAGLYFLVRRMNPKTGSLHEPAGSMYSHGLASIALCEAFAMTRDEALYQPAQLAINFICYAQDPVAGGWRYLPREGSDTSVLGWQIMALKSGHMAYLQVPPGVVARASAFLDSVQSRGGANYGYTTPGAGEATTAIGLLCRMYLGWKKDEPALVRGVEWLGNRGPSGTLYHNYYATQVMRHWEGDLWTKWNVTMRDSLVRSQARSGHETGSWFMESDRHGSHGGRLYCTAMATMILEVYYRYLPIYDKRSTEEDFPTDEPAPKEPKNKARAS